MSPLNSSFRPQFGAVTRVRNACAYATHQFFQSRDFLYIHTPIVTTADCEGAGEMFQVTTLLPSDGKGGVPRMANGDIDYNKDFFGKPTGLTVSGQLQVESFAVSMSDVYTFGPTFRAEASHTSRHLAEFWMIEPEIVFATLEDDMNLAEDYLKFCTKFVRDHCADDVAYFNDAVDKVHPHGLQQGALHGMSRRRPSRQGWTTSLTPRSTASATPTQWSSCCSPNT